MKIQILDHGYIELIELWGSDERIIEAARMSTNKGFLEWGPIHAQTCPVNPIHKPNMSACSYDGGKQGDEKLLSYLYKNKHMTPFEMAGMIIEVQAPIFVFREWHRHRTQSYNELSARYTELPNLFYVPSINRLIQSSKLNKNKQESGSNELTYVDADVLNKDIIAFHQEARQHYEKLLEIGIAKEIARLVIPVAQYSRMRASANLRNWLQFLTLRMAPNAQWEIRQYADAVHSILKEKFPRTMQLFDKGSQNEM